jgi:hypothetical protein
MDLARLATVAMMTTTATAAACRVYLSLTHTVSFRNALCLCCLFLWSTLFFLGRQEEKKQKMMMKSTMMKPWWMLVAAAALLAPGWTAQFLGTTTLFVAAQRASVRFCRVVVE